MLKKAKAGLESGKAADSSSLSQSVLKSSHQIWLAGLGAFAKAQTGGVKVFEGLVKRGASLEAKTRHAAAATADAAREAATSKAKEMHAMAGGTWDKLEQVFQERVARALGQLGVYTSSDVERLTERVNELSKAVNALLKAQGIKRPPPASSMERMVRGAVKSATRTASRTVSSATGTAAKTVSKATKHAKKTVKVATRLAKAAMK
jgi:poly(hydroxyalkanoate) granule-associated protein